MLFNSVNFIIFFPIVLLVYYILPDRIKYIWLLVSSYYFYMCWNVKYVLLILVSTIVTYTCGLLLEKVKSQEIGDAEKTSRKKWVIALSFAINLGILFYFKYTNFIVGIISAVFGKLHIQLNIPQFDILLPVGISFYTFQALGYTMDVYRNEINAEKNFLRYALFVSFFPQLVAGPIERSKNLLKQLQIVHKFDSNRALEGFLLMLWGYFLKIVLADRISIYVDTVYGDYVSYGGFYLLVAALLFAIQIYCDFAGYSIIAKGSAKILGIELMENFNSPYLTTNINDFWKSWHISLTTWFTDYVYIPLGGNRKGKLRKYINKMIVFLVSGLWHGASICCVVWGGLNGVYQIIGEILTPLRNRIVEKLHLNRNSIGHKLVCGLTTFWLFSFSLIFFRIGSMRKSLDVIISIFKVHNPWILFDGSIYNCGLDIKNFWLMIICIVILFFADYKKKKGVVISSVIMREDAWFKCIFIAVAIGAILLFGKWGPSFDQSSFIYFQF